MDDGGQRRARKAVIAISSHVARGSVGNRAAVFALEMLGHAVWSVPTIMLPWHPGHGPSTPLVPPEAEFAAFIRDLARAPWLGEVGALLTGYLGAEHQAAPIAELIAALKGRNPEILYLCDPVIGDVGGLYVPENRAAAIRDLLLPLADIATPNRFELCWLSGMPDLSPDHAIADAARALGPARVLVTSVPSGTMTGNMLVTARKTISAFHERLKSAPNGLGDLTSALFLAHILDGLDDEAALARTTASVRDMLARTSRRMADELTLEADAECLIEPDLPISVQRSF